MPLHESGLTHTAVTDQLGHLWPTAGKGAAKNWKFTVRMVEPDGSAGRVFKKWMDETGYYPKGFDPAAPAATRDNATKKARAKANAQSNNRGRPCRNPSGG